MRDPRLRRLGPLRVSKWESFERVSAIAHGIQTTGRPSRRGYPTTTPAIPATSTRSWNAYRGEWESLRAYAEDWAESTGLDDLAGQTESPYITVDIDSLETDLGIEMHVVETDHHTVYIFDPYV